MSSNIKEETIVSLNETLLEELELDAEGLANVRGGAFTLARLGTTTIGQFWKPIGSQNGGCGDYCARLCIAITDTAGTTGTSVFTRPNSTGILPGNLGGLGGGTLGGL